MIDLLKALVAPLDHTFLVGGYLTTVTTAPPWPASATTRWRSRSAEVRYVRQAAVAMTFTAMVIVGGSSSSGASGCFGVVWGMDRLDIG